MSIQRQAINPAKEKFDYDSQRIRENCCKAMTSIIRSEYFSLVNQDFPGLSEDYYIGDDRINVDFQFEAHNFKFLEPVLYAWPDTMADKRGGWTITWRPNSFDPDELKRYCEEIRPETQKTIFTIESF